MSEKIGKRFRKNTNLLFDHSLIVGWGELVVERRAIARLVVGYRS